METNSKRTMLTTLGICLDRKVREMTTSHGTAPRSFSNRLQEKVSIMDAPSRLLAMITLDNFFQPMA